MPLPKGTQPEYVGGRRNRFFRGYNKQERINPTTSTKDFIDTSSDFLQSSAQKDFEKIAVDYNISIEAATKALFEGDHAEYAKNAKKAAHIISAYKKYRSLTEDYSAEEKQHQEWVENYSNFRRMNNLDGNDEALDDVTRYYNEPYNDMHLEEVRQTVEDNAKEAFELVIEEKDRVNYINKIKNKHRDFHHNIKPNETDDVDYINNDIYPETKENPVIVVEPDGTAYYYKQDGSNEKIGHNVNHSARPQDRGKYNSRNNSGKNFFTGKERNPHSRKEKGIISDMEEALKIDKYGALYSTWRPRLGPFQINTSRHGINSVSLHLGPFSGIIFDRKGRTGLSSVRLGKGVSYRFKRPAKENSYSNTIMGYLRRKFVP